MTASHSHVAGSEPGSHQSPQISVPSAGGHHSSVPYGYGE